MMQLGIDKLVTPLQMLAPSNVYFITSDSVRAAVNLGLYCLLKNRDEAPMKYLILNGVSRDVIKTSFYSEDRLKEIRAHVFESGVSELFLDKFISDLRHYKADESDSLFVVITDDRQLTDLKSATDSFIKRLSSYFREIAGTLLFITYGDNHNDLNQILQKNPTELGGLAALVSNNGSYLDTLFWKDEFKNINTNRTEIIYTESGLETDTFALDDDGNTVNDIENCYTCTSAFTPSRDIFKTIIEMQSNKEVFDYALKHSKSATCFFIVSSRMQVEELGELIYKLRKEKGLSLHIFILETVENIRANSENYLLSCGANYVFPYNSTRSHINTMLRSLHNAEFKNQTSLHIDILKKQYFLFDKENNGYLNKDDFIKKIASFVSSGYEESYGSGALAMLLLNEGCSKEVAVSQFKPKRGGDYCTISGSFIVIFYPSCREGDLIVSLTHTFNVDINKLFSHVKAVYSQHEILKVLNDMKNSSIQEDLDLSVLEHSVKTQNLDKNNHQISRNMDALCEKEPITISKVNMKEI